MRYGYRNASKVKGCRSTLNEMAAKGIWCLNELENVLGIVNHLYTFITFVGAVCIAPSIVFSYIIVSVTRRFCIRRLEKKYPHLEIVKNTSVRSALDTRRNQGIITVLLRVKGQCDANLIKTALEENIIEKRDNDGLLVFPHLRTALTSRNFFLCWGRYAWQQVNEFDLDNHLIMGNALFRGRPVSELNIQEYVSEFVSKYLPPELPPWQMIIIPSFVGQDERYFLLIRVHHLLLSEDHLSLGDLLLLENGKPTIWKRLLGEDDENPINDTPCNTPLKDLFETPVAIPKLLFKIRDTLVSWWNYFVHTYDPAENLRLVKAPPYLHNSLAVFLLIIVASIKHFYISLETEEIFNPIEIIRSEAEKRYYTFDYLFESIYNTFNPKNIIILIISQIWWFVICTFIRTPLLIITTIRGFFKRKTEANKTVYSMIIDYLSLFYVASKELLYVLKILYTVPRILLEDLFFVCHGSRHQLQTVSLCGRKVVSWSDPIPLEHVRRIANATNTSSTAVLISATAGSLREYFRQFGLNIPDCVLSTARYFPLENLITPTCEDKSHISRTGEGFLCLQLPTKSVYGDDSSPMENLKAVEEMLSEARQRQPALYLASMWHIDGSLLTKFLPTLAVRLLLNHLSRRYAVTLTEVSPNTPDEIQRKLKWNHEVDGMMYWRPPQANVSVSLTILSYGDVVRLGVMADSLLSPQHCVITIGFLQQLNNLARATGVQRDRSTQQTKISSRSSSPQSSLMNDIGFTAS